MAGHESRESADPSVTPEQGSPPDSGGIQKSDRVTELLGLLGLIAAPIALILGAYFFLESRFVDEPIFNVVREEQKEDQQKLEQQLADLEKLVNERQDRILSAVARRSPALVSQIQRLESQRLALLLQPDVDGNAILELEAQIEALVRIFRSEHLPLTAWNSE